MSSRTAGIKEGIEAMPDGKIPRRKIKLKPQREQFEIRFPTKSKETNPFYMRGVKERQMIIKAVKSKIDFPPGINIRFASAEWCCQKMSNYWIRGLVRFGDTNRCTINDCPQVTIGEPYTVGIRIDCCPFCGAEIDVNITESV